MIANSEYSAQLMGHFFSPRHAGLIFDSSRPAAGELSAEVGTPASDAVVTLQLRIVDEKIAAVGFLAHGCVPTIATASWLCEQLAGLEISAARTIDLKTICEALQLPPHKRFCAVLAEDALLNIWKQIP